TVERMIRDDLQRAGETGPIEVLTPYADTAFRVDLGTPQMLSQRRLGSDGPDDGRLPGESGLAAGSVEAARIDVRFEGNRARDEATPRSLREQLDSLHAQLEASQPSQQTPQRDQGRGF